MILFRKQPADQLDYDIDFSKWLPEGDTIDEATSVSSVPDELVIESVDISGQTVTVWLSGGLDGKTYKVTTTVTSTQGRIKELDLKMRVKDC